MKPKIKDGISVLHRQMGADHEVNFILNASGAVQPYEMSEAALRCIEAFDGTRPISEIASIADVETDEVRSLTLMLEAAGLLAPASGPEGTTSDSRYSRQLNFLSAFESSAVSRHTLQSRLAQARVVIIGLGAIGACVSETLARAGVQNFALADPDTVESSNLTCQCLYTESAVGEPKTQAVARALRRINPAIRCTLLERPVKTAQDCIEVSGGAQIIINCADEPSTDEINRVVTEAAFKLELPHILCGGYDGHLGFLGPTVLPGQTACWHCYELSLEEQINAAQYRHLLITTSDVEGGSLGAVSAIVANHHALEAIKVLSKFTSPAMLNRTAEFDFLSLCIHYRSFCSHEQCPHCGAGSYGPPSA